MLLSYFLFELVMVLMEAIFFLSFVQFHFQILSAVPIHQCYLESNWQHLLKFVAYKVVEKKIQKKYGEKLLLRYDGY
ncbi:MAG: hypothetical protein EZS28_007187 [Streblomastix strix]|uniref:Uncharacterized protein n=1 Tax=Streblomastix strix TaxID=222440 RepID=A0A5J4WQU8_9EUKA|nr:MAG: hypothetical protein EZS28_007187 [Streblomastix strix]